MNIGSIPTCMCLEAGHVEIGDEINYSDSPRHKRDVLKLGARPLDHLDNWPWSEYFKNDVRVGLVGT